MNFLNIPLKNLAEYRTISKQVGDERLCPVLSGVSGVHKAHIINSLCSEYSRPGLVITADEGEARRMCEDLRALGGTPLFYSARDFIFRPVEGASHEYEHMRISILSRLIEGDYTQVVCCVDGLLQHTLSPESLYCNTFTIKTGDSVDLKDIAQKLVSAGYVRSTQVDGAGQFAVRGGILDVFSTGMQAPVRVELWGDEVDTISFFDPQTQRRTESVDSLTVAPASETLCGDGVALSNKIAAHIKTLNKKSDDAARQGAAADIARLRGGAALNAPDKYFCLCESNPSTLLDYTENAIIFISEQSKIRERAKSFWWQMSEDIKDLLESGALCRGLDNFAMTYDYFCGCIDDRKAVFLESFIHSSFDVRVHEPVNINARKLPLWSGSTAQLKEDLLPSFQRGFSCVVLVGSERAGQALADDLIHEGINAYFENTPKTLSTKAVTVTVGGLSAGMEYPNAKLLVISHGLPKSAVKKYKRHNKNAKGINSLDELKKGDYVVHAAHGIGIFEGIHKLEVHGLTKDYIKIKYKGADILYVPVTQLDLVSKYIGTKEEVTLKLHKLGGSEWQKAKTRTRAAVKDMAKQLIALYAKRSKLKGYAFSEDTDMQSDFECRFEYEETEDQLRCISEIKRDMQSTVPMERLLCGDVGFGKTEVALRAAFKCVAEGKQCAILVPTTILAFQHYQTAIKRLEGFPVIVEQLSRFVKPKEQARIIEGLKLGRVDIIIGTHRLISKDVEFKNLGLLIVDEEQRFGVAQKERLKEMFPLVDVLTLSATPIPRTLNMAMSGIRDMSVIEEAPQDRYPVQTYVLEYDFSVITDALRRELRRGGQVYYVHNNIDTIEQLALRISMQFPDSSVAVAHGRMSEEELSVVWRRLLEGEIDILVCTTIIETGVDVSNVNTLIIDEADKFGLAQLHQLRGRVGRSSRRAYAYLLVPRGKALSDIASRRLEAIRDFTEFGAGFKIAMRDLEIRGAGNILGSQQHGNMEAVGYDMYIKLLNDAIFEEKGEKPPADSSECLVDLQIEAHIPDSYIPDLSQRLFIYRRIADILTQEDALDVIDELIDRFGEPPIAVKGLIDVALARNTAAKLGITEIGQRERTLLLYPKEMDMEKISLLVSKMRGRIMVNAGAKPYIAVKQSAGQKPVDTLLEALSGLQDISNNV